MYNDTFGYRLEVAYGRLGKLRRLQSKYVQYGRLETEFLNLLYSLCLSYLDKLSDDQFNELMSMVDDLFKEATK